MNTILSKLVEIEAALRSLREELAKVEAARDIAQNEVLDYGKLVDVTPVHWLQWFSEFKFNAPTPMGAYEEFFPNLMLGYENDGEARAHVEQTPFVSNNSKIKYALQVWLVKPVDWLTVEFWIPPEAVKNRAEFFLAWRSSVGDAQNVEIYTFERDAANNPLRRKVATRLFPSLTTSDVIKVPLSASNEIVDRKVYFSFPADSFHSLTLEDVRMLVATDA